MTAALPAPPVYRYTLRRGAEVVYVGPEPPELEPGSSSCARMEWLRGPGEWGGQWAEPEEVF